jgi:hypothetical protein
MMLLGAALFSSCSKKLELDVIESACKDIAIVTEDYEFVDDGVCGNSPENGTLEVTFTYDNADEECIHDIEPTASFYDGSNNELGLSSISWSNDSILSSGTNASINSTTQTVTYQFCYQFQNLADTANLNYVVLDWHTENELDNESNEIGIRANIPGAILSDPGTYDETVNVINQTIDFRIWDDAAEDGDIISVNVNGVWQIENKFITNVGETITLNLNSGSNYIVFYAVSEGDSGPNTLSTSYNDGLTLHTIEMTMNKGETYNVQITAP